MQNFGRVDPVIDKVGELTIIGSMPARAPRPSDHARNRLIGLGARIREVRKRQRVTATSAAEAAGLSRPTWHRIERGEPGVAMGAWAAAAEAVGLRLDVADAADAAGALPETVRLADYPQLRKLAWQEGDTETLEPKAALELYERNWRHVDRSALTEDEATLIERLSRALGGGRLLD